MMVQKQQPIEYLWYSDHQAKNNGKYNEATMINGEKARYTYITYEKIPPKWFKDVCYVGIRKRDTIIRHFKMGNAFWVEQDNH